MFFIAAWPRDMTSLKSIMNLDGILTPGDWLIGARELARVFLLF
jgi:hypothetical protein